MLSRLCSILTESENVPQFHNFELSMCLLERRIKELYVNYRNLKENFFGMSQCVNHLYTGP